MNMWWSFLDIFVMSPFKAYFVGTCLNCLEFFHTIPVSTHAVCFYGELNNISFYMYYHRLPKLFLSPSLYIYSPNCGTIGL